MNKNHFIVVSFAILIMINVFFSRFLPHLIDIKYLVIILFLTVQFCMVFSNFYLINQAEVKISFINIFPKDNRVAIFFFIFIIALSSGFIGSQFDNLIIFLFKKNVETNSIITVIHFLPRIPSLVLGLIIVIFVAVNEEFYFRFHIQNMIGEKVKGGVSVLISAILFSLIHVNLVSLMHTLLFAVIVGFIYLKTKNIFYPILIHFFQDSFSIISDTSNNFIYYKNIDLFNIPQIVITFVFIGILSLSIRKLFNIERKNRNIES